MSVLVAVEVEARSAPPGVKDTRCPTGTDPRPGRPSRAQRPLGRREKTLVGLNVNDIDRRDGISVVRL